MISARERVHKAFNAARDAIRLPDCVIYEYNGEAKHNVVCDEMTRAVEFDRMLIRNGHEAEPNEVIPDYARRF